MQNHREPRRYGETLRYGEYKPEEAQQYFLCFENQSPQEAGVLSHQKAYHK